MIAFSSYMEPFGMFACYHAVYTSFSYLLILAFEIFSVDGFMFFMISACVFYSLARYSFSYSAIIDWSFCKLSPCGAS
jgi:Golgi nucleoside diphosphatase